MTKPLVAVGMTVETQLTGGSPASPWVALDNVQSISGGDITVDFTEITGKSDTVVQRIPNRVSPGTITFTILATSGATTELQRWRNAIQFKTQFNVRVNCGLEAPTAYWLQFNAAYVAGYTHPQLGSTGTVTYSLTFQLTS